MAASTWWWVLAGIALVAELLTGTIYLLMIVVGLVAGAIAAHLGLDLTWQIVVAAVVSVCFVLVARRLRLARAKQVPASADSAVNLDIGETVHVSQWLDDGTARVQYRGAQWTVILRTGATATPGLFRVAELQGNRLVVENA